MKYVLLILMVMLCPLPLFAADPPTVVPVEAVVVVPADSPPAARDRMTRAERKLAREVIADAADACGMRRLQFMRAVDQGDPTANDELKVSLAAHDDVGEIDIDRLREILEMILEFISKLIAMFGMFADDRTLDAVDLWCVNVGFDLFAA